MLKQLSTMIRDLREYPHHASCASQTNRKALTFVSKHLTAFGECCGQCCNCEAQSSEAVRGGQSQLLALWRNSVSMYFKSDLVQAGADDRPYH